MTILFKNFKWLPITFKIKSQLFGLGVKQMAVFVAIILIQLPSTIFHLLPHHTLISKTAIPSYTCAFPYIYPVFSPPCTFVPSSLNQSHFSRPCSNVTVFRYLLSCYHEDFPLCFQCFCLRHYYITLHLALYQNFICFSPPLRLSLVLHLSFFTLHHFYELLIVLYFIAGT